MHLFIELALGLAVLVMAGYILRKNILHSERSRKLLTRLTQDIRERYGVAEIYKDKQGNKWFGFTNPARMPATRGIYIEIATRQADMNMTDKTLLSFLNKLEASMEKGKFVDAAATVAEMKGRLTWAAEEDTLLNLAAYYFVIQGEPVETVVDEWISKKKELFRKDAELKAFFLTASFKTIRELSEISESDILGYLAEKSVQKMIRQSKGYTKKSKNTSTE